ncbi:MAG: MFS transporter [Sphingomonadales bacterium]|nr:MFS transporter [Sphingomonadales bacterium]
MTKIDSGAQDGPGTAFQGALLAMLSTLAVAAALLIAPIVPHMAAAFPDDPNAQTKAIMALVVPALVVAITAPFVGRLAERIGRKPVLLTALCIYLLCGIAPIFLSSLDHIIVSRIGVGLGEAGVMTASTALIGDYFRGARREHWIVVQTGVASIASVAFGVVSGFLGEFGWRTPFFVYAMPVVYIPLVLIALHEPVQKATTRARAAFPWSKVSAFYAIGFPAALLFFIIPIQTPFLLTARDMSSPLLIGITGAVSGIAVTVGGFCFKLISNAALNQILGLAFALIALGLGLFVGNGSYWMTWLGVVLASIGCGMTLPAVLTSIMRMLSFEERGRGTGAWQTAFFTGNFLSPVVILGLSAALNGLEHALLAVAGIAMAIALLCVGLFRFPAERGDETPGTQ